MDRITTKLLSGIATGAMLSISANAAEIDTNMAQMQAMDKITGKVSVINVPVNGNVNFGSFSILVRACKTRPPEDTPENFAFVDVVDNYNSKTPVNIFRGWMISSSPALNPVEHPIYDVWLLKCINGNTDNAVLLSQEELKARDALPKVQPLSSETKLKSREENDSEIKTSNKADENISSPLEKQPNFTDNMPMEEVLLQNHQISDPSSLSAEFSEPTLPEQPQQVEEGAPQSLFNIGNNNTEPETNLSSDKPIENLDEEKEESTGFFGKIINFGENDSNEMPSQQDSNTDENTPSSEENILETENVNIDIDVEEINKELMQMQQ